MLQNVIKGAHPLTLNQITFSACIERIPLEVNPPTNFYVDTLSGHGTIHYNLNHIPLS